MILQHALNSTCSGLAVTLSAHGTAIGKDCRVIPKQECRV